MGFGGWMGDVTLLGELGALRNVRVWRKRSYRFVSGRSMGELGAAMV